jgi:hypothetical protein
MATIEHVNNILNAPSVVGTPFSLKEKRWLFTDMISQLIQEMKKDGLHPALAYVKRCDTCKVGRKKSLHKDCLAGDIDLYDADGNWLSKTEDHKRYGEIWESWGGTWGGRFSDGNHYSLAHNGRK